jgi:hypothetical protein
MAIIRDLKKELMLGLLNKEDLLKQCIEKDKRITELEQMLADCECSKE